LYQYIVIVKPLELRIRVKILMKKKRHMIINKHIRHLISHGIISLDFVMSEKKITDLLTKYLTYQQVIQSLRKIGRKPLN
jgi:hypothetical protein